MAKDLTSANVAADQEQDECETQRSNSGWRREKIVDVMKRVLGLMEERAAITADINEIMQKEVKGDLEMKISDFKVALRYYKLDTPEDRESFLDTIRECFLALGVGEQGDFFSVLADSMQGDDGGQDEDGAPSAGASDAVPLAERPKAYQAGYSAGEAGKNLDTNKYKSGTKLHGLFVDGWNDAQAELVNKLAGKPTAPAKPKKGKSNPAEIEAAVAEAAKSVLN